MIIGGGVILRHQEFYSNAEDWFFTRIFAQLEGGTSPLHEEMNKEIKKVGKYTNYFLYAIMILVAIIIGGLLIAWFAKPALDSPFMMGWTVLIIFMIGLSIVLRVTYQREFKKIDKKYFVPPKTNDKVLLYKLTSKGIYINDLNRPRQREMSFLDWKEFVQMSIGSTYFIPYCYTPTPAQEKFSKRFLKQRFKHNGKSLGHALSYPIQIKYDQLQAVHFLHQDQEHLTQLPIPKQWTETGEAEEFIDALKAYVTFEDDPLIERFIEKNKPKKQTETS